MNYFLIISPFSLGRLIQGNIGLGRNERKEYLL